MTGIELYTMYWRKLTDMGCYVPRWDRIQARDRDAWNALAAEVQLRS